MSNFFEKMGKLTEKMSKSAQNLRMFCKKMGKKTLFKGKKTVRKGKISVNLSIFLEKMRIQQELDPTPAGPWLPVKTRVMVNVAQASKNSAGLLAKFYTSNRDIVLDKRYPLKFFQQQTEVKEDAHLKARDPQFWAKARHDSTAGGVRAFLR